MDIEVNNVELYYQKTGKGRPLVLLHRNGTDHKIFDRSIPILARRYTVYALDARGNGESSPVDELHYDDMTNDLLAFLEALDLRDAAVYGFCDGGIVALMAAAQTDRITDLIISSTNLDPTGFVNWYYAGVLSMAVLKHDPRYTLMMHEPGITDEMLRNVSARTLVLSPQHDIVRKTQVRHIAETVPNAELRTLPGQRRGSYVIHKTLLARILLRRLRK